MKANDPHTPGKMYLLDTMGTKGTYVKHYQDAYYFKIHTKRHPYDIAAGDENINGLVGFYDCDQAYKEATL